MASPGTGLFRKVLHVPAFVWVMGGMAAGAVLLDSAGAKSKEVYEEARAAHNEVVAAARASALEHSLLPAHPLALPPPSAAPQSGADNLLAALHPAGASALE